jgi:hypothetical protein
MLRVDRILMALAMFLLIGSLATLAFTADRAPKPAEIGKPGTTVTNTDGMPASVLLVDDDWDFDCPGGGRNYYTSTLDALEHNYVVWDTSIQGAPTAADMVGYDTVVWFTGYAWSGILTSTVEAELMSHLMNNRRLILFSADYIYAAGGVNAFMQNYLGVASAAEDVTELDPVGTPGDPIGDGLGPYSMTRPDQWCTYWPTGGFEGPYDDYLTSTMVMTGEIPLSGGEPFMFNASGQTNSTWYEDNFRTVFAAWPLEWIGSEADRAAILGAMIEWSLIPVELMSFEVE